MYRRYNSYRGKVGKTAKNKLRRRFMTDRPLQKLVTDVTEFRTTDDQKLYLSPIMDLYNMEIISYSISVHPSLDFVMTSLQSAVSYLNNKVGSYRTTIHSDQGWQYQHKSWVNNLKKNGIIQSMSRKGNCLDNSPMENFFGLMKQEIYYGEKLVNYKELQRRVKNYIDFYNHNRIKEKLGGLSPIDFRKQAS